MGHNIRKAFVAILCTIIFTIHIPQVSADTKDFPSLPARSQKSTEDINKKSPYDYTLVWMSDTQYYAKNYPYIYLNMVEWIANNKEKLNIPYVFHTGDIVNTWNDDEQWQHADKNMKVLETAKVPYGILAGNHDIDPNNNGYSQFSKYFGSARFERNSYYGGSYKDNRGHYDLMNIKGNEFIMIYMGWGIGEQEVEWMKEIVEKHPDRIAFIGLHDYLTGSGKRSRIGQLVYDQVIRPNKNVAAILSGHYYGSETLVDHIDDDGDGKPDRKIYQMLANYQSGPEGGQGYLRLLQVKQKENKIHVKTYSPYLNGYNFYDNEKYPEKDEFYMEIPLEVKKHKFRWTSD
ncbi:metallophosphoesterase [Halobacillus campisalis]|uniref:Metallophosphoesterase n=1 Tax=Halobacillus campisalis TaxID=435909 RepID=A0ABW2K3U0_9BACI|nr:metallophosphoesterase [Halobacillus campisalis]